MIKQSNRFTHTLHLLADFHIRKLKGRYYRQQGSQTADCSLSHISGYFKGHLGTFPAFLWQPKVAIFPWEVGPSPSMIVATKTGILSHTMIFS